MFILTFSHLPLGLPSGLFLPYFAGEVWVDAYFPTFMYEQSSDIM
jgi:hypothetical protein